MLFSKIKVKEMPFVAGCGDVEQELFFAIHVGRHLRLVLRLFS